MITIEYNNNRGTKKVVNAVSEHVLYNGAGQTDFTLEDGSVLSTIVAEYGLIKVVKLVSQKCNGGHKNVLRIVGHVCNITR